MTRAWVAGVGLCVLGMVAVSVASAGEALPTAAPDCHAAQAAGPPGDLPEWRVAPAGAVEGTLPKRQKHSDGFPNVEPVSYTHLTLPTKA